MAEIVVDTHALIWFLQDSSRLSPAAIEAMENSIARGHPLVVSSISLVEVVYLVEKGRVAADTFEVIARRTAGPTAAITIVPFDRPMAERVRDLPRDQTPDMPDRMIAATALFLGLPLVTIDARIRRADISTIW